MKLFVSIVLSFICLLLFIISFIELKRDFSKDYIKKKKFLYMNNDGKDVFNEDQTMTVQHHYYEKWIIGE